MTRSRRERAQLGATYRVRGRWRSGRVLDLVACFVKAGHHHLDILIRKQPAAHQFPFIGEKIGAEVQEGLQGGLRFWEALQLA